MSDANCCGVLNINGANFSSEWECISCHSNEVSVDVEDTPRYDRALHVIRTVNDDWFEYDLMEEEVNDFAHWYDNVPSDDLKTLKFVLLNLVLDNKIVFFVIKELRGCPESHKEAVLATLATLGLDGYGNPTETE